LIKELHANLLKNHIQFIVLLKQYNVRFVQNLIN